MEETANELLEALTDDYIGDELTMEDLRNAYSAFVEDEQQESSRPGVAVELL
jgi:predicted  nucleic acid-binding Zn-ribbon protein